ncbi:zinc-binding dehydrogenase [Rathayibacter sp. CAU 1779]
MPTMNAAVVTSFDEPPHYREFETPRPTGDHEVLADVLAVGLHPRVRSQASGSHYTSAGVLPAIPGVDGVARMPDGTLVYFASDDDTIGTMADKAIVDVRRSIPLPADADVARIAASMNPAMSSWVSLRKRVPMQKGASVLVLGATGSAGTSAVQVAKRLGAGRVVAAGRNRERLEELTAHGVDAIVQLTDDADATSRAMAEAAADVDIALDYVWSEPAAQAIMAILTTRQDRERSLDWIGIGATAGPNIELPSVAFRSANFRLQGSGQGSVGPRTYLAELPSLVEELQAGTIGITPRAVPLADVEAAWNDHDVAGARTVLIP